MRNADVVIIGGGVVGASVAYHLSQRGVHDIVVLEAESEQGNGSTGKATGGIRAQFGTEVNIRMSLYSLGFFKNWDVNCGYEPRGYLFFTTDPEQLEHMKRTAEFQRGSGVRVSDVSPAEIAEIVPGMRCDDIAGGLFGADDGFIDPIAVMRGFTEKAVANGVRIEFGTRAEAIETVGGKVTAVVTNKGRFGCGTAILCTGARAGELAASAGVELPVVPMRRQIAWVRSNDGGAPRGLPMVIDAATGFHFRPARTFGDIGTPSARSDMPEFLIAYPDPDETPSINCEFDNGFTEKVLNLAKHRADFLYSCDVVREKCRAGLYENTPDHHAIIGGCAVEGLFLANGFSGHGVMHSPATGHALAEIILDGNSRTIDVSQLSIERFAKGELMHETAFI